jgi:hypothetical protein
MYYILNEETNVIKEYCLTHGFVGNYNPKYTTPEEVKLILDTWALTGEAREIKADSIIKDLAIAEKVGFIGKREED